MNVAHAPEALGLLWHAANLQMTLILVIMYYYCFTVLVLVEMVDVSKQHLQSLMRILKLTSKRGLIRSNLPLVQYHHTFTKVTCREVQIKFEISKRSP